MQGAAREVQIHPSEGDRSVPLTAPMFLGFGFLGWFFFLSRLLCFPGVLLNYRGITQASFIHLYLRDPGERDMSLC